MNKIFWLLSLAVLFSCSSHKKRDSDAKSADAKNSSSAAQKWDYDKIREVRKDEKTVSPVETAPSPEAKLSDDCRVVTAAVVKQSKLSSCRKLDARLGLGSDMFCCPRL